MNGNQNPRHIRIQNDFLKLFQLIKIFQVNRFKSYQLQFTAYQIQAGQMVFVRLDI